MFCTSLLPHALRDNTEESWPLIFSSEEISCPRVFIHDACDRPDGSEGVDQGMWFWQGSVWAPSPPPASPSPPSLGDGPRRGRKALGYQRRALTKWLPRTQPPLVPSLPFPNHFPSNCIRPGPGEAGLWSPPICL